MKTNLVLIVALASSSCALFAPTAETAPEKKEVEKPLVEVGERPLWADQTVFSISSTTAAMFGAVGIETLPDADPCWSSGVLLTAVRNRALNALAQQLDMAPDSEAAIAFLKGAEVKTGWFDGKRTLYALATIVAPENAKAAPTAHTPSGGVPILQLASQLKEAARAHLDATGVCRDPYKRLEIKCCGGPATFCSDQTRWDRGLPGGKCACGDGPPCHQDFVCEERQGAKKCICRGAKCGCEIRGCSVGQTCGDGRCY